MQRHSYEDWIRLINIAECAMLGTSDNYDRNGLSYWKEMYENDYCDPVRAVCRNYEFAIGAEDIEKGYEAITGFV
jgi:hypothetical protein